MNLREFVVADVRENVAKIQANVAKGERKRLEDAMQAIRTEIHKKQIAAYRKYEDRPNTIATQDAYAVFIREQSETHGMELALEMLRKALDDKHEQP